MTKEIEVLDALPGSGKTYAILECISKYKEFTCNSYNSMV